MLTTTDMLTVPELADRLRVSLPRAYALIEEAGIPHMRLSPRRIRIPAEDFETWLSDQTVRRERTKEKETASR